MCHYIFSTLLNFRRFMNITSTRLTVALLCSGGILYAASLANAGSLDAMENTKSPVAPTIAQAPKNFFPDWLDIGLGVELGATYDDNIFLAETNEEEDVYYNISPILELGVGDTEAQDENFLLATYRADIQFFQDNSGEDNVEQLAKLDAQYRFSRLTTGFSGYYEDLAGGDVELGDRVDRQILSGRITNFYLVSDKTSFEINGQVINRDYDDRIDSFEYFNDNWIAYQILPKVNLGVGFTWGAVDVSSGPDQIYYQGLARILYAYSDKLTFLLRGGYETRDFDDEDSTDEPVFGFVTDWEPFDGTKLNLNAYRTVRNSAAFSGQNITLTGAILSLEQDIFQKVTLNLRGGYEYSEYTANESDVDAFREDDYYFVRLGAEYSPKDWLKVMAYYQYRENDSNQDDVSFGNNQLSVRVQLLF